MSGQKSRIRNWSLLAAALVAAGLAADAQLASADPTPTVSCADLSTPCVTTIRFVSPDAGSITQRPTSDGDAVTEGTFKLSGDAEVQRLSAPVSIAQAAQLARDHAEALYAPSLAPLADPFPLAGAARKRIGRRRTARAAGFGDICQWYATVHIPDLGDGYNYHMHAITQLNCPGVDIYAIDTSLQRDGSPIATNGTADATGEGGGVITTDVWAPCHYAGSHTWTTPSPAERCAPQRPGVRPGAPG